MLLALAVGVLAVPALTLHAFAPTHALVDLKHIRHLLDPVCLAPASLAVLAGIPLMGLMVGVRQWFVASRWIRGLAARAEEALSGDVGYLRIPGDQVSVFTAGFRHPRIYATDASERQLTPEAFHAALLHERAHGRHQDVRWAAVIAVLRRALGGMPWVAVTLRAVEFRAECAADDYAIALGARRRDLFDAIAAAGVTEAPGARSLNGGAAEQRLRRLTSSAPAVPPVPRIGFASAGFGLLAPAILAHVLVFLGACGVHPGLG